MFGFTKKKSKQENDQKSGYIVVHAGGRQGFIQDASLIFASKTNSADYHGEMNEKNFMKWFENMLRQLEEPSLIIMDNASYHSTLAEKAPTSATLKADMQQWLRDHNIPFDEKMLKPQLLELINSTTKETSYTKNIQTNNGSTTITSTTVQTMRQFSQVQTQRSETRFSITGSESASELLRTINFPELPSRLSNLQIDAKPFQPGSSASRPAIKNTPTTPASSFARQSPQYSSYQSPYFNRTYSKYSNSNEKSPPLTLTHSATQGAIAKQQPYVSSGSLQSLGSTPKSIVPTYNTNGKRRGKLLLINNTKFETNEERKGAAKDGKDLKAMFKNIGFNVDEAHKDLKSDQMLKKITQFRKDSSLEKYDMSVVVIMSHGNNFNEKGNPVPGGYTQIFGTDEVGILVDDILDQFSSEKCKYLKGKPKIFIFQCCRGTEDEFIAKDSGPTKNVIKQHSDMLIAFSTLPGYLSNRDPLKGTWYIQSICEVFNAHAKDFDIEALLKIVDERLSKKHPKYKQTSTYESRGFKRCYLNPVN